MYFNSANLNLDILSIIKTTFTLIIKIKWKKLDKNTVLILLISISLIIILIKLT